MFLFKRRNRSCHVSTFANTVRHFCSALSPKATEMLRRRKFGGHTEKSGEEFQSHNKVSCCLAGQKTGPNQFQCP